MVGQLIEAERAATIERRIVGRWGPRLGEGRDALRDVPAAATIAGRAPAELASMDLAPNRAGGAAAGRPRGRRAAAVGSTRPSRRPAPAGDPPDRPLDGAVPAASSGAARWTRCRPATSATSSWSAASPASAAAPRVAEVEEFYAPYEPYRGLVGTLTLAGLHRVVAQGPPLRLAA